ncbi:zinc-dependent metalloprotease family protein [Nocardioides sp. BYT-33-1]|uniref:fibronectin type III domain-containing protein n=1 Tax=Nocardioides sp. BYT-33-1 TaxID=3416952 RepID=UPI003F534E2A
MQHLLRAATGLAGLALALGALALPAAAAETDPGVAGLSAAEQRLLAEDPAIDVAADGTLFAVDEWHPPAEAEAAAAGEPHGDDVAAAAALADTASTDAFALHSRPGAARTIYLDFDGGGLLGSNSWLQQGLTDLVFDAWSMDGSPLFSDDERAVVREVWTRVAEDFAPWEVDVTTQEPPLGALWRGSSSDPTYGARVAFTNDSTVQAQLCRGECGGIAWIGTFDAVTAGETRSPAWVFPDALGHRAKNMAEAASHEAGHTLGLSHDGSGSSGYYGGTTLWGPLMGSPYSSAITQWSKGDYPGANNHQDDLAVMRAHGLPPRTDEAGSTPASAAALATLPDGRGVISSPADSDWYTLTECVGTLTATATPVAPGPNLDVVLELRDAAGGLMAAHAPATTRTRTGTLVGMGASLALPLTGGPYYLSVSGGGSGTGGAGGWDSEGYDDYGSIGSYHLLMAGCAGGAGVPVPPPTEIALDPAGPSGPGNGTGSTGAPTSRPGTPGAPAVRKGSRGGRPSIGVAWTPPAAGGGTITGYVIKAFRVDARGRVVARRTSAVLPGTLTGTELVVPRKGRWSVRIKARNDLGWGRFSPRSAAAKAR